MTTYIMLVVFIFVPLFLAALTDAVTVLHSPLNVRAESSNGSSVIYVKWSKQEGVPYNKATLKVGTTTTSFQTHERLFPLSGDNTTRMACFRTAGGRCPNGSSTIGVGPGRQWTYGSEILIQVGACSSIKSESCLMSSWVKFVVPLGVPDSVDSLTAEAAPGLGIDVSWLPPVEPRGSITKYIVSYKTAKDDITKTTQSDGPKTYVTITGLEPATNYTVWVTAYNARYKGKQSENVTAATLSSVCSPSPCQHYSTCSSVDTKPTCKCTAGAWKGTFCNEPKGYRVRVGMCFPSVVKQNHFWYKYYNVSLASCKSECDYITSNFNPCSSFVYVLGYLSSVFSNELRRSGIGSCYLSQDTNATLVPCSGDFYKVEPEKHHSTAIAPHSIAIALTYDLTSLFVSFLLLVVW